MNEIADLIPAIKWVSTPFSLIAFLAAAIVIMHARSIGRAENLIKNSAEPDRKALISGALEILNLREGQLTRDQRFDILMQQLRHRRLRAWMAFVITLLFAVIFFAATITSFFFQSPRRDETIKAFQALRPEDQVDALLATPLPGLIVALHGKDIFEISDASLVTKLVEKTAVPQDVESNMTDDELAKFLAKRYDSIPSVKELRRRSKEHVEPFRDIGAEVTATVPEDRNGQPWQFFAYVPKTSEFGWRTVRIENPGNGHYINVFAIPGINEKGRNTYLHINSEQQKFLNGGPFQEGRKVRLSTTSDQYLDPYCSIDGRNSGARKISKEICESAARGAINQSYIDGMLPYGKYHGL